jgi:hypothetical protein
MKESSKPAIWRWMITDPHTGRRYLTQYHMTETRAREGFGKHAAPIPGTMKPAVVGRS